MMILMTAALAAAAPAAQTAPNAASHAQHMAMGQRVARPDEVLRLLQGHGQGSRGPCRSQGSRDPLSIECEAPSERRRLTFGE